MYVRIWFMCAVHTQRDDLYTGQYSIKNQTKAQSNSNNCISIPVWGECSRSHSPLSLFNSLLFHIRIE